MITHHYPWLIDKEAVLERAKEELTEAKQGGVDSLIELSTPDLNRDVERHARRVRGPPASTSSARPGDLARRAALDVGQGCPDEIADIFVREIEVGIADTGIKAGVIKVANDAEGVTPQGELILRAVARTCKRTGTPISTHHWAFPLKIGRRQAEIFQEEDTPMDRVCIGHTADTVNADYIEDLLNTGVYISMDRYPGPEDGAERPNWVAGDATPYGQGTDQSRLVAQADARPRLRRLPRFTPRLPHALPLPHHHRHPRPAGRRCPAGND